MSWKNDKRTLVILVPVVILVWGVIVWRVLAGIQPEESKTIVRRSIKVRETPKRTLLLNYADPFVLDKGKSKHLLKRVIKPVERTRKRTKQIVKPKEPEKQWPEVVYLGIIKNLSTKKHTAILKMGQSTEMVVVGQSWNTLTVIECEEDSVQLGFEKQKKWLKK